jgi:hypothetical protein
MENKSTNKNYNPTVTVLFDNAKFGEGSLLSPPIDQEGYDALMQNISIGSRLLLKRSSKIAKNGSTVNFLEILKPLEQSSTTGRKPATKKARSTPADEI